MQPVMATTLNLSAESATLAWDDLAKRLERFIATWDAGDEPTLADITLYAYTHVAHEGGFDLDGRPAVRAWLDRVASQPGHVPIDA